MPTDLQETDTATTAPPPPSVPNGGRKKASQIILYCRHIPPPTVHLTQSASPLDRLAKHSRQQVTASIHRTPVSRAGGYQQNGKLVLHLGENPSSNTAAMNSLLTPMTATYCLANTGHPLLARRNRWQLPPLVCTVISHSQPTSNVVVNPGRSFPILVNGCTGKMGKAVAESALSAGLQLLPVSFSSVEKPGRNIKVGSTEIQIHGPSERESLLSSIIQENPDLIVVDYTVPDAVNANADLYCKLGVPFVMGTTGGDRHILYKTVQDANVYAVISPQMGKQVVAFLAAMEIMADQFPGAFSGYSLEVMESHQANKLDTSGTAKAVISCFQKLGINFDLNQIKQIRDPKKQVEMVGVPEEYLAGHAFHLYHLTSPDESVSFEFQHNVCGRSIYAEGSIDAAIFLHKKVKSKAEKRIYDMIDVLREGNMR